MYQRYSLSIHARATWKQPLPGGGTKDCTRFTQLYRDFHVTLDDAQTIVQQYRDANPDLDIVGRVVAEL